MDEVGGAVRREPVDEAVGEFLHPGRELGDAAGVNALLTSRRSLVWSGGSMLSRWVISSALRSPGMPVLPLACAGSAWCAGFFDSRGSASACRASAYRVTSHASTPLGSRVHRTGACSRSQA